MPSLREPQKLAHSLRGTPTAAWINKNRTFVRRQRFCFCWRKRWDSNPRYREVQLISSQSRYDHFDTLPYCEREYYIIVLKKLQEIFEKRLENYFQPFICFRKKAGDHRFPCFFMFSFNYLFLSISNRPSKSSSSSTLGAGFATGLTTFFTTVCCTGLDSTCFSTGAGAAATGAGLVLL